jgi:hypothetical protein
MGWEKMNDIWIGIGIASAFWLFFAISLFILFKKLRGKDEKIN